MFFFFLVQLFCKKTQITLVNWTEYLCDFLEMIGNPKLCANMATIKRGHYGLLDTHVKLGILCELVNQSLESNIFREKLDEIIEQRQALGATRRGEALEEGRKKREEKERLKSEPMSNGLVNGHLTDREKSEIAKTDHGRQSKDSSKNRNGVVTSTQNGFSPVKRFRFLLFHVKIGHFSIAVSGDIQVLDLSITYFILPFFLARMIILLLI